jgi:carbon-monoxide dehydrogenase large subunit
VSESSEAERPAQYVGARVLRVEDPRFLRGKAKYIDDISLPGMLHAAFLRSTEPHARLRAIDTSQAQQLEGVTGVFTGADLKGEVGPFVTALPLRSEVNTTSRLVLPVDKVRHVGEAIAVVVAESRYVAEDACDLIDVEYEPLPVVLDAEQALRPDAPVLDEELGQNNIAHIEESYGDVDKVFEGADRIFSKRFHHGRYSGVPLEGRGVVAEYESGHGQFTIWSSTQIPHFLKTKLTGPLGVAEGKIRVIAPAVGGGFGVKAHMFVEEAIIPTLARILERPVKWVEDRYEHLAASAHSKEEIIYIDIATRTDGTFVGFRARYITNGGAYSCVPYSPLIDSLTSAGLLPSHYHVRDVSYEVDGPLTNKCMIGSYRGVGWTPGHTARECLIDDIADELGIDPVELRVMNTIPPEPYTSATGSTYDGGSYVQSMRKAQELVGYSEFRARQATLRGAGRFLGIGFSPYVEPTGFGTKIAQASGWPVVYYDTSSVTVDSDGSVTIRAGLQSHGQGHETSLAQLAADQLGVRLESVKIVHGDTEATTYGMGTYASRSAVVYGGTIIRAARDVREKLVKLAAAMLETSEEDIELYDGQARVKGAPGKAVSIAEVAAFSYWDRESRELGFDPALTATRSYDPEETFSNGTVVAIAEVDVETGYIDLQRIVAIEDCGVMLNPMIVEGQVAGAVAQGIGGALYEDLVYDAGGQFLAGSLMDYLYPSTMEVPPMDIGHIETPSPVTEGGIKGMGEAGAIAAPAAVVNAVADALRPFGVRIDRTPLTPSYILACLEAAQAKEEVPSG